MLPARRCFNFSCFSTLLIKYRLYYSVSQVAVCDDAVAGPAALIGVAAVPLASLAEGVPIEGRFCLTNPVDAQPAGSIQICVAWHNPRSTDNKQLQGRLPLVLQQTEGTTASSMQEQFLQHQAEVVLQKAVPVLPSTGECCMPSISSGAVAAVAAALDRQQQLQLPLLQTLGTTSSSAAAAVTNSMKNAEQCTEIFLVQRPQQALQMPAYSHRYSSVSHAQQLVQRQQDAPSAHTPAVLQPMLLSAADEAAGRTAAVSAAGATGASNTATGAAGADERHATPVMWQAPAAVETWGNLESTVYFKLEALQLTDDALNDPGLQHILLAHMFCEDFTSAADQCTSTVAKR
jgi:hypothetical protein